MKKSLAYLVLLAAVLVVPLVTHVNYFIHLAVLSFIFMIVAQGLNVIQGYTGYVSIAQGAFMGVGAYASALLSIRLGIPAWACLVIAPLVTALSAVIAGYPSLRVKGHYFAIVTLALNMVVFTVLVNWISMTGGEPGLPGVPPLESIHIGDYVFKSGKRQNFYYIAIAALLLCQGAVFLVMRSRVGQVLQAIRQNEMFVESLGVSVWHYKLFAFVFSAWMAGFAGALYAHYMGFISPTPFSVDASLNAILAVIMGGSGTLAGPLLGGALTILLPEVLRVAEIYRLAIYGVILILIVIYLPKGLVPALGSVCTRLRKA